MSSIQITKPEGSAAAPVQRTRPVMVPAGPPSPASSPVANTAIASTWLATSGALTPDLDATCLPPRLHFVFSVRTLVFSACCRQADAGGRVRPGPRCYLGDTERPSRCYAWVSDGT